MRAVAGTRCSALAMIAVVVVACSASADAQQKAAAPAAKPFEVTHRQDLGSPGKISMAVGASRVFIADTETGVVAHSTADLLLVWAQKVPSSLPPVIAGDQVFVASGGKVHALDEATGREKWTRDLGEGAPSIAANGTGVLGAAGRVVRAWSADGLPAWQHEFDGTEVSPGLVTVDAGVAYVGLANRTLAALDSATGAVKWQKKLPAMPRAFTAGAGHVYFGGADQSLFAYSRGGGRDWRFKQVDVIGAPTMDDRLVFVALWDNTAQAFERGSGKLKWRTALPTRAVTGPWVIGDDITVPLTSGSIASINRKTGVLQPAPKSDSAERPRDRLLAAAASATGGEIFEVMLLQNNSRMLLARRRAK